MRKSSVKFCEDEVLIAGAAFDHRRWPLLKDILDTLDRRRGVRVGIFGSIQSWKSFAAQLFAIASFHLRPGRMAWYGPSGDFVEEFAEDKFNELFASIPANARILPTDRNKNKLLSKSFPHMSFRFLSENVKAARQSKTLQIIICDEAWMFGAGHLKEIRGRYTAHIKSCDYLFVMPSSCWDEGSECDDHWKASDQRTAHVVCPSCAAAFYPDVYPPDPLETFDPASGRPTLEHPPGGLRYDASDAVRSEDGRLLKTRFAATVTYQCPHCGSHHRDLPLDTLHLVALNPEPDPDCISFLWNALCHMPLVEVALLKAQADDAFARGDPTDLEDFDRKRAMRPWNPMRLYRETKTESNIGAYAWEEPWENEHFRTLKIDVQQGFFWWSVHLWSAATECRLFACGRAYSDSQLREIQIKYGVRDHGGVIAQHPKTGEYHLPQGCGVAIDGNYDTARVRQIASEYHWIVLRGDSKSPRHYIHKDRKKRIWAPIAAVETFSGQAIPERARRIDRYVAEIIYSPSAARDVLRTLQSSRSGSSLYTYPRDTAERCPDYLEHATSWTFRHKKKARDSEEVSGEWVQIKRHDDLEWCDRANIVLAGTVGLIGATPPPIEDSYPDEKNYQDPRIKSHTL